LREKKEKKSNESKKEKKEKFFTSKINLLDSKAQMGWFHQGE